VRLQQIFLTLKTGIYRFGNFGHRPWWYGGMEVIFAKKKDKKLGDGSKTRNKLCIKS